MAEGVGEAPGFNLAVGDTGQHQYDDVPELQCVCVKLPTATWV